MKTKHINLISINYHTDNKYHFFCLKERNIFNKLLRESYSKITNNQYNNLINNNLINTNYILKFLESPYYYHNDNGPAVIHYQPNEYKSCEYYYLNGKMHNENGPGYIKYTIDG